MGWAGKGGRRVLSLPLCPLVCSPATAPTGNTKPSLTGARIKQRKGVVKSQAKFEPEEFRDAVIKHLESVPNPQDWDAYVTVLDKAGNTLDYRKYADQLFETLIVGGLLAPGGTFVDDDAAPSPFSVFAAPSADVAHVKPYVTVMDKLIRRYKFLQKILEDSTLRGILQYINRYDAEQRAKLAIGVALMIQTNLVSASVLTVIQKDHLAKDGVALDFTTSLFRAYLQDQSMDHLGTALRKGGIKSLNAFFPPTKREQADVVATHFRSAPVNLPAVAEYWNKRALKEARDAIVARLAELRREAIIEAARAEEEGDDELQTAAAAKVIETNGDGAKAADGKNGNDAVLASAAPVSGAHKAANLLAENNREIIAWLQEEQKKLSIKDEDFVGMVWEGLMRAVDWSNSRSDQIEAQVLKETNKNCAVLEKFTPNARAELALVNAAQVGCYEDTRMMKAFPNMLKVFYNRDVISDSAILYWHQKGAKPQGKQHFLKATEPLVKFLKEQEEDDDDEEEDDE